MKFKFLGFIEPNLEFATFFNFKLYHGMIGKVIPNPKEFSDDKWITVMFDTSLFPLTYKYTTMPMDDQRTYHFFKSNVNYKLIGKEKK